METSDEWLDAACDEGGQQLLQGALCAARSEALHDEQHFQNNSKSPIEACQLPSLRGSDVAGKPASSRTVRMGPAAGAGRKPQPDSTIASRASGRSAASA